MQLSSSFPAKVLQHPFSDSSTPFGQSPQPPQPSLPSLSSREKIALYVCCFWRATTTTMPQTERDARIYGISLSETQNSCPLPPLMEWTINLNVQTDNMPYVKRLLMEEHEAALRGCASAWLRHSRNGQESLPSCAFCA